MISERFGQLLDKPLKRVTDRIKINPDVITITGFIITTLSAILIPVNGFIAGILLATGSLCDVLDGSFARNNKNVTRFGAFLDSTLDRFSDGFLFAGLTIHFYLMEKPLYIIATLITLILSFNISYIRARVEGLGGDCRIGWIERPERIILLIGGLITGLHELMIWILLTGSFITVIQRIRYARKTLN